MVADLAKAFAGLPPEPLSRPFPVGARQGTTARAAGVATPPGATLRERRDRRAGRGQAAASPGTTVTERGFAARHSLKIAAGGVGAAGGLGGFSPPVESVGAARGSAPGPPPPAPQPAPP